MPATIVQQHNYPPRDGQEVLEILFTDAGVDVKGATGNFATFDTMYRGTASWIVSLTALDGGTAPTVTFTWQHSPNGSTWFDIASESSLAAVGHKTRFVAEHLQRYLRVRWATTGTPDTATATVWIRCR